MLGRYTADVLASSRKSTPIKEMRQFVVDLKAEGQNIVHQAKAGKRDLTEKEQARCKELEDELAVAAKEVERIEALMDEERRMPAMQRGTSPVPNSRWRDTQGNPVPVLAPSEQLSSLVRPRGMRQGGEGISAGEFVRGIITGQWPSGVDMQASLAGGSDTAGGYLLEPQLSSQIIDLARNQSVLMRAGARTVPMSTSELAMVKVESDPTISWTVENQTLPASESTFGRLTFRARKMGAIVKLSAELVEDAPNASQIIEDQLGAQLGLEMDRAGLLGNSDGAEPRGLFEHPDVQELDVSAAIDYDQFLDGIKLIEDVNGMANAAVYAPAVKNGLAKLKDSQNNYLAPPQDFSALLRLVTKQLANSQAALGDFTQVMFGVRVGVQIETSRVAGSAFADDQVWIRARWRGDVQLARPNHLARLINIS